MDKILLIGGFGFIGKNIIEALYENYEISVIARRSDEEFMKLYKKITYYKFDFGKNDNIRDIIHQIQPSFILNLVSIVTAERDLKQFDRMIQTNFNTILELYEASKDLKEMKLFLQFGSGEEYGNIVNPFNENSREHPNSPYALTKQLATNTAIMLYENHQFPIAVVRPGNLFGKYQPHDKFVPYIVKQLLYNKPIYTTLGEQKRDFLSVEKFAEKIKITLDYYNELTGNIFNISSGNSISLKQIILFCKHSIESTSDIYFGAIPYRENEIMDFVLDNTKFNTITNSQLSNDIYSELLKYIEYIKGENI